MDEIKKSSPNIIVILVDDMGYSDIGCYGGEIETPNIDSLACNGICFSQFYNTARCCPTRASLLTGLHPHQTGIGYMTSKGPEQKFDLYGYKGFLNQNCVTIAEVLKQKNYHTYLSGKWHVGMNAQDKWPLQRGFEKFYGILQGGCNYFEPSGNRGLSYGNDPVSPEGEDYYTTDAFTDYAIKFIDEKEDNDPFFLYLAYNAPHWPLQAKEEDVAKYRGKYMCGWDELRKQRYSRLIEKGIIDEKWPLSPRDPDISAWDELGDDMKDEMDLRMSVYAAQVHCMDRNVGRLKEYLEKANQLHNTIIFFLSDNGGCAEGGDYGGAPLSEVNSRETKYAIVSYGKAWANASNTPFKYYKHFVHEGGIATPLIIHWPDIIKENKGKTDHSTGYLIDIMPTILEIAGAEYPSKFKGNNINKLEGKSLMPLIQNGHREPHEYMFWEHEDNCTVRKGKWKAIQKYDTKIWELYDMEQDRTELKDLSVKYPEILSELSYKWYEWARTHHVIPKRGDIK